MKINNKGFTLIELLGVIVVLVLILLVAIPSITTTYEKNKKKINEQKKEIILNAAELYASLYKKDFEYESFLEGTCGISIQNLLDKKLVTSDELKSSDGNNLFSDTELSNVKVKYFKNDGTYEIDEGINECGLYIEKDEEENGSSDSSDSSDGSCTIKKVCNYSKCYEYDHDALSSDETNETCTLYSIDEQTGWSRVNGGVFDGWYEKTVTIDCSDEVVCDS